MSIKIVKERISLNDLKKLAKEIFGDMVKAVVDIRQEIMAVGCEMHADAEAVLLKNGSKQKELWGINIYPNMPKEIRIDFSSLINIRPSEGNKSMEIQNPKIREKIKRIVEKFIEEV